jgi:hypothetical protein
VDGEHPVGAAIGVPFSEMSQKFTGPFEQQNEPLHPYFYLADIVLQKEYRRQRLAFKMYSAFESEVKKWSFEKICFCRIASDDSMSQKLDAAWIRAGFEKTAFHFFGEWKILGEKNTSFHPMIYWIKDLDQ